MKRCPDYWGKDYLKVLLFNSPSTIVLNLIPFVPFDGATFLRATLRLGNLDFFSGELFAQVGKIVAMFLLFGPLFVEKKGYKRKKERFTHPLSARSLRAFPNSFFLLMFAFLEMFLDINYRLSLQV